MKTIFIFLIFTLCNLKLIAQIDTIPPKGSLTDSINGLITELDNQGHFTFKNIPIDGSLNNFVGKLKNQGFTVVQTTDLDAILSGKFTGEDVHLLVQASPKTVYGVTVSYKKQTSWKAIKADYDNMKFMLTSKYGDPIETIEKFDSSNYQELGLELHALSEDKCTYRTHFKTKAGNGMIRLWISSDASLVLNYVDSHNYMLVSGDAFDDL